MLKCIHKTPPIKQEVTKFVTDFDRHYIFFEKDKETLFDIDGNVLSQFECRDKIQEAVFASNRAIAATNTRTLYFYNIKERTTTLVRPKYPIHGLFPGPDFSSFYIGTRQIRSIDFRLVNEEGMCTAFRLEGASRILSAIRRCYFKRAEPMEVSISHIGPKTYVCNKTSKVVVFTKPKSTRTLKGFPLSIYTVIAPSSDTLYLAGAQGNTIKVFDENVKEIFAKEVPFAVKDILTANNQIVAVCEFGALFVLNFKGEIIDGGLLAKEIIDCQASHDGFLWCLTADSSLMILDMEEEKETVEISRWLHLDAIGRKSPLQEAFLRINETEKEQTAKETTLQAKLSNIHQKEIELKKLELKLKKDSTRVATLIKQVQKREKTAEATFIHAKDLEAKMTQMDSLEELSKRLLEHHQRAIDDKAKFPEVEKEINDIVLEIQNIENRKAELTAKIGNKKEELSRSSEEIKNLTDEEQKITNDLEQVKIKLSELNASITEKKTFINDAPQRMQSLEQEEKDFALNKAALEDEITVIAKRVEKAQLAKTELEKKLSEKTKELNQILSSAKIVKQKEKDIPKIQELSQKLIALIEEVQAVSHV